MFVERKVHHSALFTQLVGWQAGAVSLPPSDVTLAQLACPLSDVMFSLHSGILKLSLNRHLTSLSLQEHWSNIREQWCGIYNQSYQGVLQPCSQTLDYGVSDKCTRLLQKKSFLVFAQKKLYISVEMHLIIIVEQKMFFFLGKPIQKIKIYIPMAICQNNQIMIQSLRVQIQLQTEKKQQNKQTNSL